MEDSKHWENIARYLKGDLSAGEKLTFQEWMLSDPQHRKLVEDCSLIWVKSRHIDADVIPDSEAGLARLRKAIQRVEESEPAFQRQKFDLSFVLKIAAIVIVGFGLSFFIYRKATEVPMITVYAVDKMKVFTLPDGSKVSLNKLSNLSYSTEFNTDNRIVELEGEAFFEVEKSEGKPFIIYNNNSTTQVIGTSFNVRGYDKEEEVEVTVISGRVSFLSNKSKKRVLLNPGEIGLMDKYNNVRKSQSLNKNALAWKTRTIIFDRTSMKEVLITLSDYYNTSITVSNPEILNCHFSANFEGDDLDQISNVLYVLKTSADLVYEKTSYGYNLKGKGCLR